MTLLLGMKPNEHEYKVMGLAPYGKEKYSQQAYKIFSDTLKSLEQNLCGILNPQIAIIGSEIG